MIQQNQLDARVNGTTLLTGLIGNPVAHTVSPVLQNSFFSEMGINGIYLPFKVAAGDLGEAVKGLKATGFIGFNVTIPYKSDVIPLVDEASEEVGLIGAANTIKVADGKLFAFNTDADGFARAFEEQTGTGFPGKKVCVLGAGGTARALSMKIALKDAGRITIVNRTEERAAELAAGVNKAMAERGRQELVAFPAGANSGEAAARLQECDIIVNTTSVGMHPDMGSSPLGAGFRFRSSQIVYDTIYNPAETVLLRDARKCGCKTVNGAGMLFYQGLKAFEIWTDTIVSEKISKTVWTDFQNYLGI